MAQDRDILIRRAKEGDAAAFAELVKSLQDSVFRLSMRMLADPDTAQDATQEILIQIVTELSSFNGDSRFETWVHRPERSSRAIRDCRSRYLVRI